MLYGRDNGWQRPDRCGCGKIPYPDEASALAAAEVRKETFSVPFRAYRCPGTARWHLATRGFHPRALKSRPRIIAWHLTARRVMGFDGLLRELGLPSGFTSEKGAARKAAKVREIVRIFADLGLVEVDDRRPPYISAVDYDGLHRVMAAGLEDYAASRGVSLRGDRGPEVPADEESQ